jgi:hypothetical protein
VFCLDDGTTLTGGRSDLQETLRITAPRATDWPVAPTPTPAFQPTQRPTRWPVYVLVALMAVGLLLGVIGVAVFGYWKISASSETTNTEPPSEERREAWASPSPSVSPTPRTSDSLVGSWRTNVTENGQATEITVIFLSEGDTHYRFKDAKGRTAYDTGTWQYSDGTLFERFSSGASGKSSLRWIDDDTVELTILDNGVPAYTGLKRIYRRV